MQRAYGGKTEMSLPSLAQRGKAEVKDRWIFGNSPNHWSNINEKKKAITWIIENYRERKLHTLYGHTLNDRLKQSIPIVFVLDCWSVNTSAEFRNWVKTTYPFVRIRYIPAGMTGVVQ